MPPIHNLVPHLLVPSLLCLLFRVELFLELFVREEASHSPDGSETDSGEGALEQEGHVRMQPLAPLGCNRRKRESQLRGIRIWKCARRYQQVITGCFTTQLSVSTRSVCVKLTPSSAVVLPMLQSTMKRASRYLGW